MSEIREYDVVAIGGGPAGIAAATCAAESGARALLVDDNPRIGGQIWRGAEKDAAAKQARQWRERLIASGAEVRCGLRIVNQLAPQVLLAEGAEASHEIAFARLILATGARERVLPFPGWTLPNVVGTGGLQALVKGGAPIAGKRVAVAGTGPLLLAVASYLQKQGARIVCIAEQAAWSSLARFGAGLWSSPAKLTQAIAMGSSLRGVKLKANCWPVAARGGAVLEAVEFDGSGERFTFACDYLACGFDLVPNLELARLFECNVQDGFVAVDEWQQTSTEGIYCAGEPTGIGGVDLALCEGQIAGLAAAGREREARAFFPARARGRKFERALRSAFALRSDLRKLCSAETIVCRCEDVTFDSLRGMTNWREAKLQTRCGMGACQGRICGASTEFLFGWQSTSARPPVFPARVETLATEPVTSTK